jgi:hypothetical protein
MAPSLKVIKWNIQTVKGVNFGDTALNVTFAKNAGKKLKNPSNNALFAEKTIVTGNASSTRKKKTKSVHTRYGKGEN